MNEADDFAIRAIDLTKEVMPILASAGSGVQCAALADLLAMWLAAHMIPGDPEATAKLRAAMMEQHLKTVRSLIAVNDDAILKRRRLPPHYNV